MIAGTYILSGLLLLVTALLFNAGVLTATTQTIAWCVIFFFASAGASAAYLTVSEIFPMETRAMAISFFYAVGTGIGGITGPLLFGKLIETGGDDERHVRLPARGRADGRRGDRARSCSASRRPRSSSRTSPSRSPRRTPRRRRTGAAGDGELDVDHCKGRPRRRSSPTATAGASRGKGRRGRTGTTDWR